LRPLVCSTCRLSDFINRLVIAFIVVIVFVAIIVGSLDTNHQYLHIQIGRRSFRALEV
jgi:hypothetical protein